MTYAAGTVVSSATPAFAMRDVLEAALSAHASWEFVKTVTVTTNDYRVWRNKGTGNGFGSDWYLFIQYATAGTGNVTYWCAETFNATTNVYGHPCPLETTTATAPAADFSFGGATTYAVGTANVHLETPVLATSQFDYFVLVAAAHITIGIRVGTTTGSLYVGLFDSIMGSTDPFPLVIHNFFNVSSSSLPLAGTTSRSPQQTASIARTFATRDTNITPSNTLWTQAAYFYGGQVGASGSLANDLLHGAPLGTRVLVTPLNYATPGTAGALRGLFKNILCFATPTALQAGDTVEVGTDTYVLTAAPASGNVGIWMNTEAA